MVSRFLIAAFLLLFGVEGVSGGTPAKLAKTYREWLNGPASYLITKTEKQAFGNLQNDQQRDDFITHFWALRASAGSTADEFREEFYRRVAWANARFGNDAGSDGWRTDRGRTYILFGRPQSTANYQFNQELYPAELWFYQNPGLAELPSFFYVLFYDKDGVGGYRLYVPYIDGPDKITRSGQSKAQAYRYLKNIDPEFARATLTFVPGEPIDTDTYSGSMSSIGIINAIQGYNQMPSYLASLGRRATQLERVTSKVQFDVPQVSLVTFVSFDKTEPWLHYQIEIHDPLQPKVTEGKAAYEITARLYAGDRLVFEKKEKPAFDVAGNAVAAVNGRPFLFEDRVPVVPGKYRLVLSAHNGASLRTYDTASEVTVTAPQSFSMGDILVTSGHAADSRNQAFAFEGVRFFPSLQQRTDPRSGLNLVYQLIDNLMSTDPLAVQYTIGSLAGSFRKVFEDKIDPRQANAFGSIFVAKQLHLDDVPTGAYQLAIHIKDGASGKQAAGSVRFYVVPNPEEARPIVVSQAYPATPRVRAVDQYERALCFLAQGREPEAFQALQTSWNLYPNPAIQPLLQHLQGRTGQGKQENHTSTSVKEK